MSDFSHGCPDCGGTGGNHYNDCLYDGVNTSGSSSLGGSSGAKLGFFIFLMLGIFIGVLCPPIGALVVLFGAEMTGV